MLRLFVPDIDCLKGLAWIGKVSSVLGLASLHPRKDYLGIFQGNLDVFIGLQRGAIATRYPPF